MTLIELEKEIQAELNGTDLSDSSYWKDRKNTIKWHRYLWNWLSLKTKETRSLVSKSDFFLNFFEPKNIDRIRNDCFCCHYVFMNSFATEFLTTSSCLACPILWNHKNLNYNCISYFSPYEKLMKEAAPRLLEAEDFSADKEYWLSEVIRLQKEIADLPEREVDE